MRNIVETFKGLTSKKNEKRPRGTMNTLEEEEWTINTKGHDDHLYAPMRVRAGTVKPAKPAKGRDFYTDEDAPMPMTFTFDMMYPFEPEVLKVFSALTTEDNVPLKFRMLNGFAYAISQCLMYSDMKKIGQDCMAYARHGDWEVNMIADGHDYQGHYVAQSICSYLPKELLRRASEKADALDDAAFNAQIMRAFAVTWEDVCWTQKGIEVGVFVKILSGEYKGSVGIVKVLSEEGWARVAFTNRNGYKVIKLEKKFLKRSRFTGGCTTVAMLRNLKTNKVKIANAGDSRVMMYSPDVEITSSFFDPVIATEDSAVKGVITKAHTVDNPEELKRIQDGNHANLISEGFLINPVNKYSIQPTRGFGDFDMIGTGHTYKPEVSEWLELAPGTIIVGASDGVFDPLVWKNEEILSMLDIFSKDKLLSWDIVDNLYAETVQRAKDGDYVDDIAIFSFVVPEKEDVTIPLEQLYGATKSTASLPARKSPRRAPTGNARRRRTLDRKGDTFMDITDKVRQLTKEMEKKTGAKPQKLKDLQNPEILASVGNVFQNMATVDGFDAQIEPKLFDEDAEGETEQE